MRVPPAHVLSLFVLAGMTACGGVSSRSSHGPSSPKLQAEEATISPAAASRDPTLDGDDDRDGNKTSAHDPNKTSAHDVDDKVLLDFGHAANARDRRAIAVLARRYYAAAAARDGAAACALVYSLASESLVEQDRQLGSSCAQIASRLFRRHRAELRSKAAALRISGARVQGNRGLVFLGYGPGWWEGHLWLHREHGAWKTEVVLDLGMP